MTQAYQMAEDEAARRRTRHGADVPTWMPLAAQGTAPEHFEVYREIQNEWWPYDVYARISIFLAFMQLSSARHDSWGGHILLTLDIMPGQLNFSLPLGLTSWGGAQRLGPFAQIVAWIALGIEYQPYYDPSSAAFGYVLVYIYTIQLLRICAPDFSAPDQAEVPQGQLPWEVGCGHYEAKRRDVHRALGKQGESPAWFNVRTGLLGLLVAWIYLVFGFTIEVANAHTTTPSFLSAGGVPNNLRDPRYRPPKVGAGEPTEADPADRDAPGRTGIRRLLSKIRSALPYLTQLALPGSAASSNPAAMAMEKSMIDTTTPMAQAKASSVRWPALFEPRLMCGHATIPKLLALSHHGRGLIITPETDAEPQAIALHGGNMGPLLAAHWDAHGLMVLASSGATFHCREAVDGMWPCQDSQLAPLPLGPGPFRGTVALTRSGEQIHAALTFAKEPSVTIFAHSGRDGDSWLPTGEVRSRGVATSSSFAADGKELLLTSGDGAPPGLRQWEGAMPPVHTPEASQGSPGDHKALHLFWPDRPRNLKVVTRRCHKEWLQRTELICGSALKESLSQGWQLSL
eukprot:Skav219069  [mRNA]  locus=scaffold1033:169325:185530:- [translate_table: standard]